MKKPLLQLCNKANTIVAYETQGFMDPEHAGYIVLVKEGFSEY